MDAKKESQETCPLCLQRRRRPGCMVCYACDSKTMKLIAEANAKAIVSGRFDDVVDPFEFVISKGREAIEAKRKEREEIEKGLKDHKKELWAEAERQVASILSAAGKGNSAVYLAVKMNQHSTIVDKFQQLKEESAVLKSHYALGKIVASLQELVTSLAEKREKYLAEMNEANDEETAVA